jgi:hypothetical protein
MLLPVRTCTCLNTKILELDPICPNEPNGQVYVNLVHRKWNVICPKMFLKDRIIGIQKKQ